MRTAPLVSLVHDDLNNYALPADFGSVIDLIPQDNRNLWDEAFRDKAGRFDREKAVRNRTISIEGSEGTKIIRINWKSRQALVFSTLDSSTGWLAAGGATNVVFDSITKYSGAGSMRFSAPTSGSGLKNTALNSADMTSQNGVADCIFALYLGTDFANLTSVTPVWGNDVTTKFFTGVAQTTQADGTAFKFGWNLIKASWAGAAQTGTVDVTKMDSFQVTVAVSSAMVNLRLDNILFSIGRNFDLKYYSKYLYKNADTGAWESQPRPVNDNDFVIIDNDTLPLFLMEALTDMAHQME